MRMTYKAMNLLAGIDRDTAVWASCNWLADSSSGIPEIALLQESVRSDALFWADTATPIELECYLLAAVRKLTENRLSFHSKHIKRLIAALYQSMSPSERVAFKAWMEKQG